MLRDARYYVMDVDLTGSRLGLDYHKMRAVVEPRGKTLDEVREMCAEHYEIPLGQVGPLRPAADEDWKGVWR